MRLIHSMAAALALLVGSNAVAQTAYPERPIKMIVPLAAASAVDVAARIVTQKMAENMGQQIVIINQAGASGLIGAEQVARATPDGYTIGGFNDSVMTMVPNLHSKMPWDILKDFEPVSLVATVEWGLIAGNNTGYKTAADLIAAAKAAPGKINYSSGGPGSPQHLAMAMFASSAGISLTHVPYMGATQAATDVASGQIPAASDRAAIESADPQQRAARKLARLIVSEIKLYDPQLVTEGVAAGRVYAKLKDQIDQGIALFERRVPAEVRASFDYMHDEVVRQLAGGDASKIGPGYPR